MMSAVMAQTTVNSCATTSLDRTNVFALKDFNSTVMGSHAKV